MINILKYPKVLAFLRYLLGWRSWKLGKLEQIALYCAVYIHFDVLIFFILIGSVFKRTWPQLVKEHEMTINDKDAQYYVFNVKLQKGSPDRGDHVVEQDVHTPFIWLCKYTEIDVTMFKKWVDLTYPDKYYDKVVIKAANLSRPYGKSKIINKTVVVDLHENKWHILGETEKMDIMFDAFPLFTDQAEEVTQNSEDEYKKYT